MQLLAQQYECCWWACHCCWVLRGRGWGTRGRTTSTGRVVASPLLAQPGRGHLLHHAAHSAVQWQSRVAMVCCEASRACHLDLMTTGIARVPHEASASNALQNLCLQQCEIALMGGVGMHASRMQYNAAPTTSVARLATNYTHQIQSVVLCTHKEIRINQLCEDQGLPTPPPWARPAPSPAHWSPEMWAS